MEKKRRKFTQCPNCGYTFEEVNNYCPNCGQENHDLNVPVKHLVWEFLEGTLHYDTKFWVTLKYLLFRPGLLTEKFNTGQRASYVPPIRLYVFVSLVFFFVLAITTKGTMAINVTPQEQAVLEQRLPVLKGVSADSLDPVAVAKVVAGPDSAAVPKAAEVGAEDTEELEVKIATFFKGGDQSLQKMLKNTSFMMFLLMPFFGYLLYLFFYRKGRNYVEHLMFSIHLHTFYFILIIVAVSLAYVIPLDLTDAVMVVMVVYLYFALKRVYKTSYLKTLLKLIPLTLVYVFTLAVFLIGTFMISVML